MWFYGFSASCSNSVFYGIAFVTVFNLFLWSNGIRILSRDNKLSLKKVFINPGTIVTYIGLFTYFIPINFPDVISNAVTYMASLNTPLAMVITGVFLANVDFVKSLKKIYMYRMNLFRLIIYPLIFILLIKVTNIETIISNGSINFIFNSNSSDYYNVYKLFILKN